jgi:hypothetical protein
VGRLKSFKREDVIMRGRKPLPDFCRVCKTPIDRTVKKLSNERLCLVCKTNKQIMTHCKKLTKEQILNKINRHKRIIKILNKFLKGRY